MSQPHEAIGPIVLGEWEVWPWGASYRYNVRTRLPGMYVFENLYSLYDAAAPPIVTAPGNHDEADNDARERGWVLLDADPITKSARLTPWRTEPGARRRRFIDYSNGVAVEVTPLGWCVKTWRKREPDAYGPQTGAEGERLAMVAALALGFVEET